MGKFSRRQADDIMSPNLRGGADLIGKSIGNWSWRWRDTFLSAQYLVNQWLDSYQIIMNT